MGSLSEITSLAVPFKSHTRISVKFIFPPRWIPFEINEFATYVMHHRWSIFLALAFFISDMLTCAGHKAKLKINLILSNCYVFIRYIHILMQRPGREAFPT